GARAQKAVRAADPAARDRILLAPSPGARRQARPRARGAKRGTAGMGLGDHRGRKLPGAARALSRDRSREGSGPLLRVRPAGVPAWLAPRSVERGPPKQECELA